MAEQRDKITCQALIYIRPRVFDSKALKLQRSLLFYLSAAPTGVRILDRKVSREVTWFILCFTKDRWWDLFKDTGQVCKSMSPKAKETTTHKDTSHRFWFWTEECRESEYWNFKNCFKVNVANSYMEGPRKERMKNIITN